MKNLFLLLLMLPNIIFSQLTCGGQYIDNGGISDNYLPNTDEMVTICPTTANEAVVVVFNTFDVQPIFDGMFVYDGFSLLSAQIPSTNYPGNLNLPGAYWGNQIPGPFVSSHPSGCLTFVFKSNGTIQNAGWTTDIFCVPSRGFRLKSFLDHNANGIQETYLDETDFNLGTYNYEINNSGTITSTTANGAAMIVENNQSNSYNFNFEIDPAYSQFYSVAAPAYLGETITINPTFRQINFPITTIYNNVDLAINIVPLSNPICGQTYNNRIVISNLSGQIVSGSFSFTNDVLTPISNFVYNNTINGTLAYTATGFVYNFVNLPPMSSGFIDVFMTVPSIPNINLGDLVSNTVSISTTGTETDLTNNFSTLTQTVVGSYDPNDITESHGEQIEFSSFAQNDYLTYTIRFENTGTAPANKVVIANVLDEKIDENSVKMVASSHNYTLARTTNDLNWSFFNIQLPVSVSNTNIGKGFVTYKAKLKAGFNVGTIVPNVANIYFDTNPAIVTNTFNTEFVSLLSNESFNSDNFKIFPNPASKIVHINLHDISENIQNISINDVLGKLIKKIDQLNAQQTTIDIADLEKGIYFVDILTASNKRQIKKLVVE